MFGSAGPAPLLSRKAAAERLNVSPVTLGKPKWLKEGPPFVRLSGNRVGYPPEKLQAWLDARPQGGAQSMSASNSALEAA